MEIIGEKINGTRQRVAQAIADRDADFVQDLARKQAEAGSFDNFITAVIFQTLTSFYTHWICRNIW